MRFDALDNLQDFLLNRLLADDPHLKLRTNKIDPQDPQELYKRCQDGILLW
jgi:hypothetical protein